MKFKSSCLVHVLFCFKLFLLSIAQDQFEYSMVLGNCTDISQAIDMKNLKLVENLDNKNLRKYFYDNYEYGYINITDVYSIGGSENTHHKIEYFNTISSVRMFSNIDARLFYIENWRNIFEESEDALFIAFGRSTDNASAEYDIILNLDKSSIRTISSDNTEFEIEYLDFKLSYRTVMQNCVNDISVQDGKLIMKTNESIYPLINFSIFINNSIEAKHFTYIEIGMIQGYPSISSFIYYPLAILYGLSIFYFFYSLMDSSIRFMFKVNNLFQLTLFYFHWYYVLMVTKLIFTYILEYYSYFKFMKFLSIIASFGGALITIFIVTQLIQYCGIWKSNECLIIILSITLYILAFYFFLFGYFWQYAIQNLWIYAIFNIFFILGLKMVPCSWADGTERAIYPSKGLVSSLGCRA